MPSPKFLAKAPDKFAFLCKKKGKLKGNGCHLGPTENFCPKKLISYTNGFSGTASRALGQTWQVRPELLPRLCLLWTPRDQLDQGLLVRCLP